jgi:flagellar biosynthesis protein FlhB
VSDEKTEEPTPRKLEEARRKGQVAVSRDLGAGAVFIAIFVCLSVTGMSWLTELIRYFKTSFMTAMSEGASSTAHLARGLVAMIDVLKAPLAAGFIVAIGLGFAQTGGLFATEALKLDPEKVMPNFKKLFGLSTFAEVIKGFVKVALAAGAAWAAVEPLIGALTNLTGTRMWSILIVLGYGADKVGMRLVLIVAIIGFADFLWQKHQHMKNLRMSHDEVKREHKESEGDPHNKAERKRFHKELLEQRMVNEVKKANFVVVNPTHIAVAIRYDKDKDAAPVVLAKGERLLAERIKQAAREAGVPIFRDVGLARALKDVEEGDEVPEALYEAIAEILRVVYGYQEPAAAAIAQAQQEIAQEKRQAGEGREPAVTSDAPRSTWRRA